MSRVGCRWAVWGEKWLKLDPEDRRLHRLRHTGPANDIMLEKRTLEQARRRGRWLSLRSLERYTKTAHLIADLIAHLIAPWRSSFASQKQESQSTKTLFARKKRVNGKHTKTLYNSQRTYGIRY